MVIPWYLQGITKSAEAQFPYIKSCDTVGSLYLEFWDMQMVESGCENCGYGGSTVYSLRKGLDVMKRSGKYHCFALRWKLDYECILGSKLW